VTGRLIVVTGTGTNIGKTHVAAALTTCAVNQGIRTLAYKPIESGATERYGSDQAILLSACLQPPQPQPSYTFRAPLSPHRAAMLEHDYIDIARVVHCAAVMQAEYDVTIIELPGGLFTPLDDQRSNLEIIIGLRQRTEAAVVVVAPNRLGVLHDVMCLTAAAQAQGLYPTAIALVEPEQRDASSATNGIDLSSRTNCGVHAVPRMQVPKLATSTALIELWASITAC
jgi:dethiobiotin synthetase